MESKSTTKYSEQYMKLCEISPIEDETEMLPIQFLILWRYTAAVGVYREISLLSPKNINVPPFISEHKCQGTTVTIQTKHDVATHSTCAS